jgi:sugar lactone lactonase YvrE
MADDIAVGPDGSLAWTGFLTGEVWVQRPGGEPVRVAEGHPGANSLDFTEDGRLFFTEVFLGDALYEADPDGVEPPRRLMADMGGLNGFDFGPDGHLYGPLWFRGAIARVDVDAETLEVVATGFDTPAAVNFDSKGNLYAVDTARGEVLRVDLENGEHDLIAKVAPAIDNLAIAPDDAIFITNMADNAIIRIDPESGATRTVVESPLAVAADIALAEDGDSLLVADVFSLRRVSLDDGQVTEIARQYGDELENPMSVGTAHGRIAVTSWSAGVIQLFDAQTGDSLGLHHDMPAPMDAVPLKGDAVLFVDFSGGRLIRADGPKLEKRTVIAEDLEAPVSVALDGATGALVSEYGAGRVVRIDLASGITRTVAGGFDAPEGFALLENGDLVVADTGVGALIRVDPSTGARTILRRDLPIGYPAPPGAPEAYIPTGVAVAPDGSVLVSSDVEGSILRLTAP